MILGELVPKSLALQYPTHTALCDRAADAVVAARSSPGRSPFLNGSGILLLKLLRRASTGHRHVHSPEEIELLIAESRDGGLLEPQEQVRLHRALRLGLRTARQLMVPRERLAAIEASTPFEDVLRLVATSPYSRLPVYRGTLDDIVGILHTKDVVTRLHQRAAAHVARAAAAADRRACPTPCRPIACSRSCASAAATRRSSSTTTAASPGDHARGRRRRAARRRLRRVQGGAGCARCGCPTAASGCPADARSIRPRRSSARLARRAGETVGEYIIAVARPRPGAGRTALTIDGARVEIEAVEGDDDRVGDRPAAGRRRTRRNDRLPDHHRR